MPFTFPCTIVSLSTTPATPFVEPVTPASLPLFCTFTVMFPSLMFPVIFAIEGPSAVAPFVVAAVIETNPSFSVLISAEIVEPSSAALCSTLLLTCSFAFSTALDFLLSSVSIDCFGIVVPEVSFAGRLPGAPVSAAAIASASFPYCFLICSLVNNTVHLPRTLSKNTLLPLII